MFLPSDTYTLRAEAKVFCNKCNDNIIFECVVYSDNNDLNEKYY